jgi:hypothetical protein
MTALVDHCAEPFNFCAQLPGSNETTRSWRVVKRPAVVASIEWP